MRSAHIIKRAPEPSTGTQPALGSPSRCPFVPELPDPIPGFEDHGYVPLQHVANTRDLGGMPTQDGKRIRSGRLIRSGNPHHATANDLKELVEVHHLAEIVDFRSSAEIEHSPDPLLDLPGVSYVHVPVLPNDEVLAPDPSDLRRNMEVAREFVQNAAEYMTHMYCLCVLGDQGIKAYTRFLRDLAETEGAVLWHCTQGKDRTGIAAMLIEHILGVSDQTIRNDYLATNLFMKGWLEQFEERLRSTHVLANLDIELEAYLYACPQNLKAALDAIDKEQGSLDAYIARTLDCGPEQQELLRQRLLVDAAA